MKSKGLLLVVLLLVINLQAQITHTIKTNINSLSVSIVSAPDGNSYSKVFLQGAIGNTCEAGKPQLPIRTIHLMIPFGMSVTNVLCSNVSCGQYQQTGKLIIAK